MKLSTYLRLSAEVMHKARPSEQFGMCWAVWAARNVAIKEGVTWAQAAKLNKRAHALLERFRPEGEYLRFYAYWGNNWGVDYYGWGFHPRRVKRCRVLFLLFLAAMEEANEKRAR